jgi:hypothetical protein
MTTTLYRAFDVRRRLIYVGISDGPLLRFNAHTGAAAWAQYAEVITLERFASRGIAAAAELAAIRDEDPVFNKYGRPLARWQEWMAVYPDGDPDMPEPESATPAGQADVKQPAQMAVSGQCVFQADLFRRAMADRGHRSELERSQASGIHRATLHRWRTRPINRTPANAHQAAAASGLTIDELFVSQAA